MPGIKLIEINGLERIARSVLLFVAPSWLRISSRWHALACIHSSPSVLPSHLKEEQGIGKVDNRPELAFRSCCADPELANDLAMGDKSKSGPNLDQSPSPTFHYLIDFVGAGDRDRTGDIQLGKLTFYH